MTACSCNCMSQQLDSSPAHFEETTTGEVSCSSCFATPKTYEEVVKDAEFFCFCSSRDAE